MTGLTHSEPANQDVRPMRGVGGWLVRRTLPADEDPRSTDARLRLSLLQGYVNAIVNIFIFVLKCVTGFMLGSIALIADAFETLSDVGAGVVVIVASKWSRKPRDAEHPFGHGRAELVAALVIAILLIVVGFGLGKEAVMRILHPRPYHANVWVIGVVALTIPIKEWLAWFSRRLAVATKSPLIEGGYWLLRFDALMTTTVCLAMLLSRYGWLAIDGWVGLMISGLVIWTGVSLVRERVSPLVGEAPTEAELLVIKEAAFALQGVRDVHDLIMHKYGDVKLVSLHIEVDAARSAMDVHDLAEDVERAVEEASGCKTIVHVDPVDRGHPLYDRAEELLREFVLKNDDVSDFHDLRIVGEGDDLEVSCDVVVDLEASEDRLSRIREDGADVLQAGLGRGRVVLTVERPYHGR